MTVVRVRGADLHVEDTGGSGEPVLFLHGFLFDGRAWDAQVAGLRDTYRCVTLDFRGQGRSEAARDGYQIEQLTADVLAVVRRLGLAPVHLVGLSMGGFVGLRLAAREPGLLRSLSLLNTSAAQHPRSKFPKQLALAAIARVAGVGVPVISSGVESEFFAAAFRADPARAAEREVWLERWARANRATLVRTLLGFMIRPDVRDELGEIDVPTLVLAGGEDVSLPPHYSREMHALIRGSRYVELAGVGHSSAVEDPEGVTRALRELLADVPRPEGERGPTAAAD